MKEQIKKVIDEQIRPHLNSHEGDLKLLDIKDGIVTIKLLGACSGCPGADLTIKDFIEATLLAYVEGFKKVNLSREVSPDLIAVAKKILNKSKKAT